MGLEDRMVAVSIDEVRVFDEGWVPLNDGIDLREDTEMEPSKAGKGNGRRSKEFGKAGNCRRSRQRFGYLKKKGTLGAGTTLVGEDNQIFKSEELFQSGDRAMHLFRLPVQSLKEKESITEEEFRRTETGPVPTNKLKYS